MNKKYLTTGAIIAILIGVFAAFGLLNQPKIDEVTEDKIKISTSIFPIYDLVSQIGGEQIEVSLILPAGSSPHTYSPSPQDIAKIENADHVFLIGEGLDDWMMDVDTNDKSTTLSNFVNLREFGEESDHGHDEEEHNNDEEHEGEEKHDGDEMHENEEAHGDNSNKHSEDSDNHTSTGSGQVHEEDEEHEDENHDDEEHGHPSSRSGQAHTHEGTDPHFWLSIDNAMLIAEEIEHILSELDPKNQETYLSNLETLTNDLENLKSESQFEFIQYPDIEIITFHDAFGYMADELGFEILTTIEPFPGSEPTPQYLAEVAETIQDNNLTIIYSEPQLSDSLVESLRNDYNLEVLVLDPIGGVEGRNSYQELYKYNLDMIVKSAE